jgi:hypothetical protein
MKEIVFWVKPKCIIKLFMNKKHTWGRAEELLQLHVASNLKLLAIA